MATRGFSGWCAYAGRPARSRVMTLRTRTGIGGSAVGASGLLKNKTWSAERKWVSSSGLRLSGNNSSLSCSCRPVAKPMAVKVGSRPGSAALAGADRVGGRRGFATTGPLQRESDMDFDTVIIGGGVIGLAAAHAVTSHPACPDPSRVLLLERHDKLGTETSSRNSEVIHAGLYYPPHSLKTKLCIQGRQMLYDFCAAHGIGFRKTGKWIVAQDAAQTAALEGMAAKMRTLEQETQGRLAAPLRWVSRAEAAAAEPDVHVSWDAGGAVLESPETGILDSHALMLALEGLFAESGGVVRPGTRVSRLEPLGGGGGWRIHAAAATDKTATATAVTCTAVVNAAGLHAAGLANTALPPDRHYAMHYAKGNYFAYTGPVRASRLLYPAPAPAPGGAGAGGLGTHLTLDLAGRIRFGPDVEWVDDPSDLAVDASRRRLDAAVAEIRRYLPAVRKEDLAADYSGIRPKILLPSRRRRRPGEQASSSSSHPRGSVGEGANFVDFVIGHEEGFDGWVNLLGIESPGLTSSLAIGRMVAGMVYGDGDGEGGGVA